jgi:hypothetical protein
MLYRQFLECHPFQAAHIEQLQDMTSPRSPSTSNAIPPQWQLP